jgi:transcriptional regulator with XRE-family HTH domain
MNLSWLREQIAARGLTQREVASIAGMTEQMLTNVMKGRRLLSLQEADAIRRAFGFTLPEDLPQTIAVIGKVGAGDGVMLADDYAKGAGLHQIARPGWLPRKGVAAALVEGASAEPVVFSGDVVFWQRDTISVHTEDLGRAVIAETEDGRVMLKILASSPVRGRWSLLSINPAFPNLLDVHLRWASRVLAPLPADQVRYLDG